MRRWDLALAQDVYPVIVDGRSALIEGYDEQAEQAAWLLASDGTPPVELMLLEALRRDLEKEWVAERLVPPLSPGPSVLELLRLLRGETNDVLAIAQNPDTPPLMLEYVYRLGWPSCLAALASNPASPTNVLQALFAQGEKRFNQGLASNPSTPQQILLHIARHCSGDSIWHGFARNPALSDELVAALYSSHAENRYTITYWLLDRRPGQCPRQAFFEAIRAGSSLRRRALARNDLPADLEQQFRLHLNTLDELEAAREELYI